MARQLLWFANPRLIKILMKGDEPVGFLFAYPDISAALQRTRGRMWPLGWADLLLEMRRTRWVNINGAAIVERYRGLGGTAILFSEMQRSIVEGGFLHADLVQVGAGQRPNAARVARAGDQVLQTAPLVRADAVRLQPYARAAIEGLVGGVPASPS